MFYDAIPHPGETVEGIIDHYKEKLSTNTGIGEIVGTILIDIALTKGTTTLESGLARAAQETVSVTQNSRRLGKINEVTQGINWADGLYNKRGRYKFVGDMDKYRAAKEVLKKLKKNFEADGGKFDFSDFGRREWDDVGRITQVTGRYSAEFYNHPRIRLYHDADLGTVLHELLHHWKSRLDFASGMSWKQQLANAEDIEELIDFMMESRGFIRVP